MVVWRSSDKYKLVERKWCTCCDYCGRQAHSSNANGVRGKRTISKVGMGMLGARHGSAMHMTVKELEKA